MNEFEKIEQIEKHPSIELSDEMIEQGWVYRDPVNINENSPEYLRKKYALAQKLCKESFHHIA